MAIPLRPNERPRLCVFVIAYYAEDTLCEVLERIPQEIFDHYECEVLVIDDASEDRTFEIGSKYHRDHPDLPLTVLRNTYNQGYGGNQKLGYRYAIKNGFDFVAMIHGDGQYAPEELPRLLTPLVRGEADAVFGSRVMRRFAALRGGMPLYKYIGNRILSSAQNLLLNARLTEFHSGYRIYSVAALEKIPFHLNSNDFHFDTEIIIQLVNLDARIVELPIPTYYGDEICRVNGMKYAKDVMVATAKNVAHKSGLLYQRRYDVSQAGNSHYDLKMDYPSSHSWALENIADGSRVIDIGAGPGGFARELVAKGCETVVVDQHAPEEPDPQVRVIVQDVDEPLQFDVREFDHILMLDIIEHLRDPERFLDRIHQQCEFEPKEVILTTPNIAFIVQRLGLLAGEFNYGKAGILDRTHTRLFTFRGVKHLLRDSGFQIEEIRGVPAPFPKVFGDGTLGRSAVKLNLALIQLSKTLFSYQIFVKAKTTPSVDFILTDSAERSRERSEALRRDSTAAHD